MFSLSSDDAAAIPSCWCTVSVNQEPKELIGRAMTTLLAKASSVSEKQSKLDEPYNPAVSGQSTKRLWTHLTPDPDDVLLDIVHIVLMFKSTQQV